MKQHIRMPTTLKPFYKADLVKARKEYQGGELQTSWRHLERAHILGQPYAIEHTEVHWKMLRFAVRVKRPKEVIGQLPRLLVGGVKSFVGVIPVGNTGGADVPPLQPLEIPEDLQLIIQHHTGNQP